MVLTLVLTHGDNVMTKGSERVKRWRDRHRALHNLRRRNARKNLGRDRGSEFSEPTRIGSVAAEEIRQGESRPAQNFQKSTIETLRELIVVEQAKPVEAAVVPLVFKDDYGRVISERQWKMLQSHKEKAKEGGYEIDDYTQ